MSKGKTPTSATAAMYALCSTTNPLLIEKTFKILLDEARDQDVIYFFEGLQSNPKTRRALCEFFKEHYELVLKCIVSERM
ncbi:hypothetical protein EIP86_003680 [Pleurotus ostreatoroseus]|nr:hypothetical protein EIP86_003680 [Pleurotus ostreatoroseus]